MTVDRFRMKQITDEIFLAEQANDQERVRELLAEQQRNVDQLREELASETRKEKANV